MSAENAWRIAREAAADLVAHTQEETSLRTGRRYLGKRAEGSLTGTAYAEGMASLPMPPAFRAEVEAEAEELRGMLAELIGEVLEHCDDRQDVNWEGDGPNAEMRLGNVAREIEARLARLEAKGKAMSDIPTTHKIPDALLGKLLHLSRAPTLYAPACEEAAAEITRLRADLAAAQERERVLREALTRIATPEAFFVATSDIDPEALGRMIYAQAVLDGASLEEAAAKAEAECKRRAALSAMRGEP